MKHFKKFISILLAVIITASVAVPVSAQTYAANESKITSISEYKDKLWEEGIPVFTTADFMLIYDSITSVISFLTGKGYKPIEKSNVFVDEFVTAACNHVYINCGLDIVSLLTNLPDFSTYELLVESFRIDTVALREAVFKIRDKYAAEDNQPMVKVMFMLGSFLSAVTRIEVYAEPVPEKPEVYEVMLDLTYVDGGGDTMHPGIFINSETGVCTNKDGTGLVGTGFEFNLKEMLVYATINAWMKDFGFCVLYDILANSFPMWNYVTRRIKFNYGGLEWMIQMWKGNYLITNGAEVGIYNRESYRFGSFYDSVTEEHYMPMSLQVLHGEEVLVNQPEQMHWWINGFQMSDRMYIPDSLTLKSTLVFPDSEMLDAVCEGINRNINKDIYYSVDGLKLTIIW